MLLDFAPIDGAVLFGLVASIGNLLQGWDNASIAGSMLYIKEEFNLQSMPMVEGAIMAMALFGATMITTISGALADAFGRRMMLLVSAVLSFITAMMVIFWSQQVYMLLLTRLVMGFSIGLAVTLVPIYISEIAPSEIRGKLNTFPQLSGSLGMLLSYCMVFWMSLMPKVDWRIMLGIQSIPSMIYSALIIFYLPESPSWLVRKGRVDEAKKVLQRLRRRQDVSGEIASLIEGTKIDQAPCLQEYKIRPKESVNDTMVLNREDSELYVLQEDLPRVAYMIKEQSTDENIVSSFTSHGASFFDPLVSLIGSVHESSLEGCNMFGEVEQQCAAIWDEENQKGPTEDEPEHERDDMEESIYDPLICGSIGRERSDLVTSHRRRGLLPSRKSGYIGGGWQLAWKSSSDVLSNGQVQDCMDRVYLHEGVPNPEMKSGLDTSTDCKFTQATALVNKSVFHKDQFGNQNIDLHSSEKNSKGTKWSNLLEPGVKRALIAGVGLQLLQQFAGINGILYYTPQILDQAGVGVLISNIGLSSTSASILMSALTTLLMLPFIGIAMWLIDRAGRRKLLLVTIPILVLALLILIVINIVDLSVGLHAALSTTSVVVYFCIFVMGFGPIPNIFCSEIFPARVRAICSAICSLTFWISDIIVTYTLPLMMSSLGFTGVFGLYAIVCILAMLFVYMRVPETRGMPLEVIAEFYALGPYWHADQKQKGDTKDKESEETLEALR
ncbi:hypothetical protein ACQ4PT_028213 [Festuca glaucescens]